MAVSQPKHTFNLTHKTRGTLHELYSLVVTPTSDVFVAARMKNNSPCIFKFAKDGSPISRFEITTPVLDAGQAIPFTVTSEGYFLVADRHRIVALSQRGDVLTTFGGKGQGQGQFDHVAALTVDAQDRIYVCDTGNHRIQVLDVTGRFIREFCSAGAGIGQLDGPTDVVVCPGTGNVVVLDSGNRRVQVFFSTGQYVRTLPLSGSWVPRVLAVNTQGAVVVAAKSVDGSRRYRVLVCENGGKLSRDLIHDGGEITGLAVMGTDILVAEGKNGIICVY